MKKSEMIRLAKKHMHMPNHKFVCIALDQAVYENHFGVPFKLVPDKENEAYKKSPNHLLMQEIKDDIRRALQGCFTVESWLEREMGIDPEPATDEQRRDYRLRWMDKMIADYEEAGQ